MTRKSAPFNFGRIAARPPPTFTGQRIGLLGGSFNPAHDGHRHISLAALARLRLDQIWWIVSPGNPLKANDDLPPLAVRMVQAQAVAHHPRIVVTGFEAELNSAFTAGTLSFLRRRCPSVRFVWLMGADNLVQLQRWRQWQDIFAAMPIAVLDRPGWHLKATASLPAARYRRAQLAQSHAGTLATRTSPAWTFITLPLSNQSSTALRQQAGQS